MRISDWSSDVCSSDLQVASGRRPHISVYGDDYETPDGSCIRDYIHVEDLCDAHLLALGRLAAGGESARYNLGNGNGFSVLEVIEMARHVTGHPIPLVVAGRREGDPPKLVADAMRSEEHTSELQSLMRISYAVFCLKKKKQKRKNQ